MEFVGRLIMPLSRSLDHCQFVASFFHNPEPYSLNPKPEPESKASALEELAGECRRDVPDVVHVLQRQDVWLWQKGTSGRGDQGVDLMESLGSSCRDC